MPRVTVTVEFVDGSRSEAQYGPALMGRYSELLAQGLDGRRLVSELLSDDWGPPPTSVTLAEIGADAKPFKVRIACE